MVGVITGAKHCELYGLGTNPGAQFWADAAGGSANRAPAAAPRQPAKTMTR